MRSAHFSLLSFAVLLFLATLTALQQPKQEKRPAVNIPALIDRLVEVAESDIGYSATVTGNSFMPLECARQFQMGLLFQKPSVPSDAMREIVKQGAAAVPHLIAHLDDKRQTKIIVRHDKGCGTLYGDEFDYNAVTTKPPPDLARWKSQGDGLKWPFGPSAEQPSTLTVGDLCFVALGQIVNRRYNAVRYLPTAFIVVSSPTQSSALRAAVKQEWGGLTPERHRASLIADLLKPDSERRCTEACRRLAYYYPDAVATVIVPLLGHPTYEDCYDVYDLESFVRGTLYHTKDARKRRELFEAYLAKKGPAYRDGILQQMFHDLQTLEGYEAQRLWPPLTSFRTQPRELLIELYGYKKDVNSSLYPRYPDAIPSSVKARLISEALIHDHSIEIDRAVRDLLASIRQDDRLAWACMTRLLGRGYDADIEKYCRRRLPQLEGDKRNDLLEMLDRLGWSLVHVAVERRDEDGLRALIAQRVDLQAKAPNGTTPLHLAAAAVDGAFVRLLVDARVALDPQNARGETPVQLAARADHDEIVRFLVQKGCAVSDILTAAISGQREVAAALLSQDGALVHATTAHQRTPLHLAARRGHACVAELLLDKGAEVNAADEDGWTPLHCAIDADTERHSRLAVITLLLERKADCTLKDKDELTPLARAVEMKRPKIVELLRSHGAKE